MPVLGYTPLMLVITFFGGLTALGLGIIGQYLWLSLQNSRQRPDYIVKAARTFEEDRGHGEGPKVTETSVPRETRRSP